MNLVDGFFFHASFLSLRTNGSVLYVKCGLSIVKRQPAHKLQQSNKKIVFALKYVTQDCIWNGIHFCGGCKIPIDFSYMCRQTFQLAGHISIYNLTCGPVQHNIWYMKGTAFRDKNNSKRRIKMLGTSFYNRYQNSNVRRGEGAWNSFLWIPLL